MYKKLFILVPFIMLLSGCVLYTPPFNDYIFPDEESDSGNETDNESIDTIFFEQVYNTTTLDTYQAFVELQVNDKVYTEEYQTVYDMENHSSKLHYLFVQDVDDLYRPHIVESYTSNISSYKTKYVQYYNKNGFVEVPASSNDFTNPGYSLLSMLYQAENVSVESKTVDTTNYYVLVAIDEIEDMPFLTKIKEETYDSNKHEYFEFIVTVDNLSDYVINVYLGYWYQFENQDLEYLALNIEITDIGTNTFDSPDELIFYERTTDVLNEINDAMNSIVKSSFTVDATLIKELSGNTTKEAVSYYYTDDFEYVRCIEMTGNEDRSMIIHTNETEGSFMYIGNPLTYVRVEEPHTAYPHSSAFDLYIPAYDAVYHKADGVSTIYTIKVDEYDFLVSNIDIKELIKQLSNETENYKPYLEETQLFLQVTVEDGEVISIEIEMTDYYNTSFKGQNYASVVLLLEFDYTSINDNIEYLTDYVDDDFANEYSSYNDFVNIDEPITFFTQYIGDTEILRFYVPIGQAFTITSDVQFILYKSTTTEKKYENINGEEIILTSGSYYIEILPSLELTEHTITIEKTSDSN